MLQAVMQETTLTLPVPPPDVMQKFEEIKPGSSDLFFSFADRAYRMSEDQSAHRRRLETTVVRTNSIQSVLGQILGFALGAYGIYTARELVMNGKDLAGAAAFIGAIGSLIWTAVYSRRKSDQELKRKQAESP